MSRLNFFMRGLRVLDLSRHLPGPLASLMMLDMGAEVIKIEPPLGDEIRGIGPKLPDGAPAYYEALTAGKEVLTLDLKASAGKARFLALADGADILIESFRPGVMAKLGFAPDTLRQRNPRLITVSLSGYGRTGPLCNAAGHDSNYLGYAGALAGNAASPFYPPIADCLGSMFALSSVLGALLARERDGRGCDIDLALADVIMPLQAFSLAELAATGKSPARGADLLNGGWACYRSYRCADGLEVVLGAVEPKFWAAFCATAGQPQWICRQQDALPQFGLMAEVAAFFGAKPRAEILQMFASADCCLSPILDLAQAVQTGHTRARGLVRMSADGRFYQALFPALVDAQAPHSRSVKKRVSKQLPQAQAQSEAKEQAA